jgi:hypothetical protein
MRCTAQIVLIFSLVLGFLACQSTKLPEAKIIRDPSWQLHYRYVNESKNYSFDFPYYGMRFFKEMDKKGAILAKKLGIKTTNVQFYGSTYFSHHQRTLVILYEKPVASAALIADNVKRLQRDKLFSQVALYEKPEVKIKKGSMMSINDYDIHLDSNIALVQLRYHAQLDKADFLASEYYVELNDKSLLRLINFVNVDPSLFDETDRAIDSTWFYTRENKVNLAYFQQPIPPLNTKGNIIPPSELAKKTAKNASKNSYLEPLSILQKDSALYDTLRPEFMSNFYQTQMNYYTFAGFSEDAFAKRDTALGVYRADSCNNLIFKDLALVKAVDFISKELPKRRILMMNEGRHMPICRLFAMLLLDSLKRNGFNYLAVQTLYEDHKINKNGFPIRDDGFHSQEPMFAELLRQAVQKGFKIIAFDDTSACIPPPDAHRFYCTNLKQQRAAERISAIFKKDKKAKVFVYVENDEYNKDYLLAQRKRREGQKYKFLAMYLKDKLGHDPLSINQSDMVERSLRQYENPLYRCVWLNFEPEESMVLTKKANGTSWKKPEFETLVDAYIFHPRMGLETPFEWLGKMGCKKQEFAINDVKGGYLCQVFYKNEWDLMGQKAIPALNLPIQNQEKLELWLRPNTPYVVRIFSKDSRLLKEMPLGILP